MPTDPQRTRVRARISMLVVSLLVAGSFATGASAAPDYASTGGASPTPPAKAEASTVKIPAKLASIAECESGSDPTAISSNGLYRGKYQFHRSPWRSMGGKGDPAKATETEQDRRALRLYRAEGTTPWPVCGQQ